MTTPTTPPCACSGTLTGGQCAGHLRLCLTPGLAMSRVFQMHDKVTGLPTPWPPGTRGRLVFNWGTGTSLIIPATVSGTDLTLYMGGSETEQVPRGASYAVHLNYTPDDDAWFPWLEGSQC
jgi:hypothetical protein